jgi:hypothetical protein
MAGEVVYIARLGAGVARALGQTGSFGADLDTEGVGLQMPAAVVADATVQASGHALAAAAALLDDTADKLDTAATSGSAADLTKGFLSLFEGIYQYVDAAGQLIVAINAKAASLPPADANALQTFGLLLAKRLMDYFALSALEQYLPRVNFVLILLGLAESRVIEASGQPHEPKFVLRELHLERVKDLVTDPGTHFTNVYQWGSTGFDPYPFLQALVALYSPGSSVEIGKNGDDAYLSYGPITWSRDSSVSPPGLKVDASTVLDWTITDRVPISDAWGLQYTSDLKIGGGIVVRLRPPLAISAEPEAATISGAVSVTVDRNPTAPAMTLLDGNPLIQMTAANVGGGAQLTIGASSNGPVDIDPGVFVKLSKLAITLGSKDADNFLASLLAGANVKGSFDLEASFSLQGGLVITAAGGLQIAIPMHQNLGIATFNTLYIVLTINQDGSFSIETSAAITGTIGPLTAAVDRMGAMAKISFADQGKTDKALGPVDLSMDFKPPSGVGLAVDAAVIKGGGYLSFDPDKGEYTGALELTFSDFLSLKAIGIVDTKLPDGTPGFSLLVIITAEFGTPIQLGFGFTLIGVGGLLGLNRTMKLDELAEGVRTGSVESVMFPQNVIANAPKIISDLNTFLPPQPDTFLIGPMAKLGWGSPALITATVGLIIEIPPGDVALLGVLKCVLPDQDNQLLVLQVKFIGALEVDKSRLWFFASLYGSRVLFITLSGEMGLLIAWGDQADFVLSVGGFHPAFTPPPTPFPVPQRVALSIIDESYARIKVEAYFAVTSNTVQFGAAADLFLGVDAFSIEGNLSFDALFQFSPFYFIIALAASVSVKVFGAGVFSVGIKGQLEGTSPWHIEGEGSITLLFFDLDVPFSLTWGDTADTVLDDVAALPIIQAELEKRDNWVALNPTGTRLSVSLRTIDAGDDIVLHPLGELRVSQRAVPLELTITKVGNQKVSDVDRVSIIVTSDGLVTKAAASEPFATGQFQDLDAATRLSAPSYEQQVSGADIGIADPDLRSSHAVKRTVRHEVTIIDSNYKQHVRRFVNLGLAWFSKLLSSNATARSSLSTVVRSATAPFSDSVKASAPGYVIAHVDDNTAQGGPFASHAAARDALATLNADPATTGQFHVLPAAEVNA